MSSTCYRSFSTWYHAMRVNIWCCTRIYPTLDMLYLIYDLWYRHSVFTPAHGIYTGTWHAIFDTDICHAIFDTWYRTSVLAMLYLTLDIRHWYLICHTWHLLLTPGIWYAFMWYKFMDLTSWLLTAHYHPRYLCIIWYIHGYHFSGDLIIILLPYIWTPELLYSWTPIYLNPWNRKTPDITPDIILLLTPVIG